MSAAVIASASRGTLVGAPERRRRNEGRVHGSEAPRLGGEYAAQPAGVLGSRPPALADEDCLAVPSGQSDRIDFNLPWLICPERADHLQTHPAEQHRLYLIPAGTPHASGAGNVVLEISATPYVYTLRFYDWLRRDLDGALRPVHLRHAFSNLDPRRRGESVRELMPESSVVRRGSGWSELALGRSPELFFASSSAADASTSRAAARTRHSLGDPTGSSVGLVIVGAADGLAARPSCTASRPPWPSSSSPDLRRTRARPRPRTCCRVRPRGSRSHRSRPLTTRLFPPPGRRYWVVSTNPRAGARSNFGPVPRA
jgi:hypothetical protein